MMPALSAPPAAAHLGAGQQQRHRSYWPWSSASMSARRKRSGSFCLRSAGLARTAGSRPDRTHLYSVPMLMPNSRAASSIDITSSSSPAMRLTPLAVLAPLSILILHESEPCAAPVCCVNIDNSGIDMKQEREGGMAEQVTIYGLTDPRTGQVCYVGQTHKTLKARLAMHVNESSGAPMPGWDNRKQAWFKELHAAGLVPGIVALETVPSHEAGAAERRHIGQRWSSGVLVNTGITPDEGCYYRTNCEAGHPVGARVDCATYQAVRHAALIAGQTFPVFIAGLLKEWAERESK